MFSYFPAVLVIFLGTEFASCCSINVDDPLDSKTPIVLTVRGEIIYPQTRSGDIHFNNNDEAVFFCSGPGNVLKKCRQQEVPAICLNNKFRLNCDPLKTYSWEELECKQSPQPETNKDGTQCNTHGTRIDIGFRTNGSFIKKIKVCYNKNAHTTYWTKHELLHTAYSCLKGGTSFRNQEFNGDPTKIYNRYSSTYQKGHLTPKCDFSTGIEKRMTYYYVNSAPQVKQFNDGNWKALESEIRKTNAVANRIFYIYTGTEGISTMLADTTGTLQLPVPKFFWKVVIDSRNGNGVAFLGVNDITQVVASPCTSKCASLRWLSNNFQKALTNQYKGIIYCCEINDLEAIPRIQVPTFSEHTGGFLSVVN